MCIRDSRHTGNLAHGLLEAVDQFVERLRRVGDLVAADDPHTLGQVAVTQFYRGLLDFTDGADDLAAQ